MAHVFFRKVFHQSATAIAMACGIAMPVVCTAQQRTLRDEFLEQAPAAWNAYRERARRFQGSVTFTQLYERPPQSGKTVWKNEFKQAPGCALLIHQEVLNNDKPADKGLAHVVNPRYGFELKRQKSTEPWAVTNFEFGLSFKGRSNDPMEWTGETASDAVSLAALGVRVDYPTLQPEFMLRDVTPLMRGGRTLAKVEFTFEPKDRARQWLRGGWILYDPEASWVQHECRLDIERTIDAPDNYMKGTYAATFEYREGKEIIPILKRIAASFEIPGKSFTSKETLEFDLEEMDAPASAFALSAFGFPDPVEADLPGRGTMWYIWFGALGVACIAAAWLLRYGFPWKKRSKDEP